MERKFNVKLVRTYKYCPRCTGSMVQCNHSLLTSSSGSSTVSLSESASTSLVITTNPPQYFSSRSWNHRCDKCGHGENYDKSYPILEYIDDGELG